MIDKLNKHFDLHTINKAQQRFERLEWMSQHGFQRVISELHFLREQGYIPVSIVEKLIRQQNDLIHPVIQVLCTSLLLVILWGTGFKVDIHQIFNVK
jgi:hypothetical protein